MVKGPGNRRKGSNSRRLFPASSITMAMVPRWTGSFLGGRSGRLAGLAVATGETAEGAVGWGDCIGPGVCFSDAPVPGVEGGVVDRSVTVLGTLPWGFVDPDTVDGSPAGFGGFSGTDTEGIGIVEPRVVRTVKKTAITAKIRKPATRAAKRPSIVEGLRFFCLGFFFPFTAEKVPFTEPLVNYPGGSFKTL